jgi:hypothetical protein
LALFLLFYDVEESASEVMGLQFTDSVFGKNFRPFGEKARRKGEGMERAIVLGEGKGLDFFDIRASIVRIPEVSLTIKEAQKTLDELGVEHVDLMSTVLSEDEVFHRRLDLKRLILSIIQVGLFSRYKKNNGSWKYIIGRASGCTALPVCAGEKSLNEMISASAVVQNGTVISVDTSNSSQEGTVLCSGVAADQYEVVKIECEGRESQLTRPSVESKDLWNVASQLNESFGVQQFVHIGPGEIDFEKESILNLRERAQLLDCIEIDPMLGWFWSGVRKAAVGLEH